MNNGKIRNDVVMYRNINIHSKQFITFYTHLSEHCGLSNRIRLTANPWFYFSKWIFGWGSIQNIPQNVEFWAKTKQMGLYLWMGLQSSLGSVLLQIHSGKNKVLVPVCIYSKNFDRYYKDLWSFEVRIYVSKKKKISAPFILCKNISIFWNSE